MILMPVHYTIKNRLVEFKLSGAISVDTLQKACYRAILNPAFESPMRAIIDISHASSGSTSPDIKNQAAILRSIKAHLYKKWAILARPGSLNFGLARMLASYIGRDDIETCVFADRPQAYRWLFDAATGDKAANRCAFPPLSEFRGWRPYP
ncbi:MAG: hypothetical protein QNI89_00960 [Desulfobacterales bacterium]|nr:hypothetical protein [Desulfobacterales bacterium]MDJ0885830.1 hypothetical protein [Desulfobacterales bacterium]MDJ0990158.1 hypothetical protein [Desulfobacterales bacterium]